MEISATKTKIAEKIYSILNLLNILGELIYFHATRQNAEGLRHATFYCEEKLCIDVSEQKYSLANTFSTYNLRFLRHNALSKTILKRKNRHLTDN